MGLAPNELDPNPEDPNAGVDDVFCPRLALPNADVVLAGALEPKPDCPKAEVAGAEGAVVVPLNPDDPKPDDPNAVEPNAEPVFGFDPSEDAPNAGAFGAAPNDDDPKPEDDEFVPLPIVWFPNAPPVLPLRDDCPKGEVV